MTDERLNHFILLLHRNVSGFLTEEEYSFIKNIIHSNNNSPEKMLLDEEYNKIVLDIKTNFNMFIKTLKSFNKKDLSEEELIKVCKYIPLRTYNINLAMFFIQEKNGKELFKTYFDSVCFYTRVIGDNNHIENYHLFVDTMRKYHIEYKKDEYVVREHYPDNIEDIKKMFKSNVDKSLMLSKYAEYVMFKYIKNRFEKCGRKDLSDRVIWASKDVGEYFNYTIFYINPKNKPEFILVKPSFINERLDSFTISDREFKCINEIINKDQRFIIARVFVNETGSCQIYLFDKIHEDYISSTFSDDVYIKIKGDTFTRKKYN